MPKKNTTLVLCADKVNYYVLAAIAMKNPGDADLKFSKASILDEELKACSKLSYKKVYIIALTVHADCAVEILAGLKKMKAAGQDVKWIIPEDRFVGDVDEKTASEIKKFMILSEDHWKLAEVLCDEFKTDKETASRLQDLYQFVLERHERSGEENAKKPDQKPLIDPAHEKEKNFRYINYVNKFYHMWPERNERLREELVDKLVRNKVTNSDLNLAENFTDDNRHLAGNSILIKNIREQLAKVAKTDSRDINVFISGETGTGKEEAARMIHHESSHKNGVFMAFNCAAVPAEIIEGTLFGYEKGAFTGASFPYQGYFRLAEKGTLFIDEIGEMPVEMQSKLLRVIQEWEIHPLGSEKPVKVDVRLVCATNKDLRVLVDRGEFREDLYYRILEYTIKMPALRHHKEDIKDIAEKIMYSWFLSGKIENWRLTKKETEELKAYDWPGNVRQLITVLKRGRLFNNDFSGIIEYWKNEEKEARLRSGGAKKDIRTLAEIEKDAIEAALRSLNFRKAKTAEALGIVLNTLKKKMKDYGIEDREGGDK